VLNVIKTSLRTKHQEWEKLQKSHTASDQKVSKQIYCKPGSIKQIFGSNKPHIPITCFGEQNNWTENTKE
jgi:hypothetical protein